MNNFSIRVANMHDALLLQRLGRQTFSETFSAFNSEENMERYLSESFHEDKVKAELLDSSAETILLYDGDLCIGFARLRRSKNPEGIQGKAIEIQRIYSVKNYIGKGVGSMLMQECINRAEAEGCETIWLGVWEKNERAIQFYERKGFERFGEHVFMLGDDAQTDWLLKKKIND